MCKLCAELLPTLPLLNRLLSSIHARLPPPPPSTEPALRNQYDLAFALACHRQLSFVAQSLDAATIDAFLATTARHMASLQKTSDAIEERMAYSLCGTSVSSVDAAELLTETDLSCNNTSHPPRRPARPRSHDHIAQTPKHHGSQYLDSNSIVSTWLSQLPQSPLSADVRSQHRLSTNKTETETATETDAALHDRSSMAANVRGERHGEEEAGSERETPQKRRRRSTRRSSRSVHSRTTAPKPAPPSTNTRTPPTPPRPQRLISRILTHIHRFLTHLTPTPTPTPTAHTPPPPPRPPRPRTRCHSPPPSSPPSRRHSSSRSSHPGSRDKSHSHSHSHSHSRNRTSSHARRSTHRTALFCCAFQMRRDESEVSRYRVTVRRDRGRRAR